MARTKPKPSSKTRIAVCIPGKVMGSSFLAGWTDFLLHPRKKEFEISLHQFYSAIVHHAREVPAFEALKTNPDYLLWLDSDIEFDADDILNLIDSFKRLDDEHIGLLSGLYTTEGGYYNIGDFSKMDNGKGPYSFTYNELYVGNITDIIQPFIVDSVGMGFCLIKAKVFKELEEPYFEPLKRPFNYRGPICSLAPGMKDIMLLDECDSFCHRIREKGYDILAEPNIIVGHQKEMSMNTNYGDWINLETGSLVGSIPPTNIKEDYKKDKKFK
tara:strand:+ start:1285 stop:2097 length:813 start_codon:yes stop_codon:yes gene_type:complete